MKAKRASIFTDGIAEPNPGAGGIAAIIKDEQGRLIASICQPIGYATNNQAEYRAIIAALERTISLGISEVYLCTDSELVVRQINGDYRVKSVELKPLYLRVKQLQRQFSNFSIVHIPREENREADSLANQALR